MAIVTIRINGRDYQVACDNGQEDHLRELAEDVHERVSALIMRMKDNPGEAMPLLLAALTMSDELIENQKEIEKLAAEIKRLKKLIEENPAPAQSDDARMAEMEAAMALTMNEIAARIEKIADQVEVR